MFNNMICLSRATVELDFSFMIESHILAFRHSIAVDLFCVNLIDKKYSRRRLWMYYVGILVWRHYIQVRKIITKATKNCKHQHMNIRSIFLKNIPQNRTPLYHQHSPQSRGKWGKFILSSEIDSREHHGK